MSTTTPSSIEEALARPIPDLYPRRRCACAHNSDGSTTTMLCPIHADVDPCLTMARVTGRRRVGSIIRGKCTSCGHRDA